MYALVVRRAEHMLVLNPTDGRALSLGSGALFEDGQGERAFEWAQRGLELYPDDMGALINAACLYAKARQKDQALCEGVGKARLDRARHRLRHPA
jgi:Flp pilus assembly protein TadD